MGAMATDGLTTALDFDGDSRGIRAAFEDCTPASGGRGDADGSAGVDFVRAPPSSDLERALFATAFGTGAPPEALIRRGSESA